MSEHPRAKLVRITPKPLRRSGGQPGHAKRERLPFREQIPWKTTKAGGKLPPAFVPVNCSNCGCPNQEGDLVQNAVYHPATDYAAVVNAPYDPSSGPPLVSPAPVRYADGTAVIARTDLYSDGFGFPWAQTRSWTNGVGYAQRRKGVRNLY